MLRLKVVVNASVLFCMLAVLPVNAIRRPDVPNSKNGENVGVPAELCPNSTATPFFAQLDGTQSPPADCTPKSDPNKPDPPAVYPDLSVTLSGSGFTVTVTPALWEEGIGNTSNAAFKSTVFLVQFSGEAGMTLQSLLIGLKLNGATSVPCGFDGPGIAFCTANVMAYEGALPGFFDTVALEPTGIDQADATTTRWDFSQFNPGDSPVALVVAGFPSEFSKIDKYPNSNALKAASFVAANFLAIVSQGPGTEPLFAGGLFAGGLTLKTAPAATNDLFSNAVIIKKVPFKSFVNTSATNPSEQLTGTGAGSEVTPQDDPIPQDPAVTNAGSPCSVPWSANASVFRSVWYTFTPTVSENYAISTAGSRYDTGVYVFTGSPSSANTVACNDDAPVNTEIGIESSYVNFGAVAGTTYHIMVSEVPPPVGTVSFSDSTPVAAPLATDATLDFSLAVGSPVVLSPNTELDFPTSQKVKTSSSLPITATNTTSKTVTVSTAAIINSGAQDFSQTNNCTTLAPGDSCTITVVFTPLVARTVSATLVLHLSGGVNPTGITLTGTGSLN
jgi:hypothetical protein